MAAATFLSLSCSTAVNVPLDREPNGAVPLHAPPQFQKGAPYRVTTMDGVEHNTRDLEVRADSVMFTAEKRYELARSDVKRVERLEADGGKTALVVAGVLAVVGTTLYFLLSAAFADSGL